MASTKIPWAPGGKYIHVTCRLGTPKPSPTDDTDNIPDLMTQSGSVRLTCNAKRIRYTEEDGKNRMLTLASWNFDIQESDGELTDGKIVGVYLLSGLSTGVDPANFTWTAVVTPATGDSWTATIPYNVEGDFDLTEGADIIAPLSGVGTLTARILELELTKTAAVDAKNIAVSAKNDAVDAKVEAVDAKVEALDAKNAALQAIASHDAPLWWAGSQADYDALTAHSGIALYVITDQVTPSQVSSWLAVTQTEYDAIATPDPTILYLITGA